MDNQKIPTALGTIIIIILAATVSVFVWKYEAIKNQDEIQIPSVVVPQVIEKNSNVDIYQESVVAAEEPVNEVDLIKKGSIVWQETTEIGDIGLTNKKLYEGCVSGKCGDALDVYSYGIKYLKVGAIVDGKYKDSDLILIVNGIHEGPSSFSDIIRIIKKGNSTTILSHGFDEYAINSAKLYFAKGLEKLALDDKTIIEELNYPKAFQVQDKREKFIVDEYATGFFNLEKLKVAFESPQVGQVWMTDAEKANGKENSHFELNSYVDKYDNKKYYNDIFGRGGFFVHLPDGTAVAYKLVLDIFDKMDRFGRLQATWSDGTKNTADYEENPSGCGAGNYVYDKTAEVNLNNDVVVVGKTDQGDNLYGYKDVSNSEVKKLYEENYYTEGKKKTIAEYLKMNPVVFWVDPFGRTLAFYRGDLLSPAECGKPVIYLYPEQPMNINVQVKPGNGLSYTEPAYNNGWNVFADTQSNLQNLSDGKTYPYLFWEGSGGVFYEQPKQGFVVARDDLDGFFNEKLAQLGLIGKEIADFKEYWIPKMSGLQKPYYFVTFLPKHYIDELAPLTIDPKPKTVIRVLMDYNGLDKSEAVQSIPLVAPERKGFTAVEWGGFLK